jgi:hypothetical protein
MCHVCGGGIVTPTHPIRRGRGGRVRGAVRNLMALNVGTKNVQEGFGQAAYTSDGP